MPDLTLDDDRATGAWVASLISTLLTLPACLAAWFFGGFSAMACDVCDGTEAARFEASYAVAFPILPGSLGAHCSWPRRAGRCRGSAATRAAG